MSILRRTYHDIHPAIVVLKQDALARWDNEGGALSAPVAAGTRDLPVMTNAELVSLRIRVIALENILIAVMASGSERQIQAALDMARTISPHPDATQHPVTIRAADHINSIVHRARHRRISVSSIGG